MMACVGVVYKLLKKKKKRERERKTQIQILDKATSVKTIYKQSSGTGIPSPCPILGHYVLDFHPSSISVESASVVSPFQIAVVLGKKENFSPSVHAFGR